MTLTLNITIIILAALALYALTQPRSIWDSLPFPGGYVEPGIIERNNP